MAMTEVAGGNGAAMSTEARRILNPHSTQHPPVARVGSSLPPWAHNSHSGPPRCPCAVQIFAQYMAAPLLLTISPHSSSSCCTHWREGWARRVHGDHRVSVWFCHLPKSFVLAASCRSLHGWCPRCVTHAWGMHTAHT